jgi:hypothetical protein
VVKAVEVRVLSWAPRRFPFVLVLQRFRTFAVALVVIHEVIHRGKTCVRQRLFDDQDSPFDEEAGWYQRRVPEGLERYHNGRKLIRESLQTKSEIVAAKKVARLAAQHDSFWRSLKLSQFGELTMRETRGAAEALLKSLDLKPGEGRSGSDYVEIKTEEYFERRYGDDWLEVRHADPLVWEFVQAFFNPAEEEMMRLLFEEPTQKRRVFLSDALERYLSEHAKGQEQKFCEDTKRAIEHVITAVGDLPLTDYVREHASTVRDHLLDRGNKPPKVRRRMNTIVAVFNTVLNEFDLSNQRNPFAKLKIRGDTTEVGVRLSQSRS